MKKFINKNNQSVVHRAVYEKRIMFKIFICIFYLIAITILALCIHELYEEKFKITPWSEVESTDEYTSIKISKMSEAFAYYDNERLKNILLFLQEKTNNHQVLIFSCTNREKEILEKEKIKYNIIEL